MHLSGYVLHHNISNGGEFYLPIGFDLEEAVKNAGLG